MFVKVRFEDKLIYWLHVFFLYGKHMKFQNQARLCLAIYDFETHIILSLC